MIIETATIYAFNALVITIISVFTYFVIFFSIFYLIAFGISKIIRPIWLIMTK